MALQRYKRVPRKGEMKSLGSVGTYVKNIDPTGNYSDDELIFYDYPNYLINYIHAKDTSMAETTVKIREEVEHTGHSNNRPHINYNPEIYLENSTWVDKEYFQILHGMDRFSQVNVHGITTWEKYLQYTLKAEQDNFSITINDPVKNWHVYYWADNPGNSIYQWSMGYSPHLSTPVYIDTVDSGYIDLHYGGDPENLLSSPYTNYNTTYYLILTGMLNTNSGYYGGGPAQVVSDSDTDYVINDGVLG